MKRYLKWIVAVLLVLTIVALLIFPRGKSFTLPFAAEDVSSVILWSFWGYKEATDRDDIAMIVGEMNDTRLCGEFDFENYEQREGDYSYICAFLLKDGRTCKYSIMSKPGLASVFRDSDGTYYKVKNVWIESIYNELDIEPQHGNPFPAE